MRLGNFSNLSSSKKLETFKSVNCIWIDYLISATSICSQPAISSVKLYLFIFKVR